MPISSAPPRHLNGHLTFVLSPLTVLVGDNLPELGADLVTALAGLDVDNLSHSVGLSANQSNVNLHSLKVFIHGRLKDFMIGGVSQGMTGPRLSPK